MEKLKISLAKYNGKGACVSLENWNGDTLDLHITPWNSDASVCLKEAADILRETIHRLETLATMKKPFHEATQKKVNL